MLAGSLVKPSSAHAFDRHVGRVGASRRTVTVRAAALELPSTIRKVNRALYSAHCPIQTTLMSER